MAHGKMFRKQQAQENQHALHRLRTPLAAGCCSRLANQQCNKQHPSAAAPANAFHANAQVIIGTHGRLKNWVAKRQLDVDRICILVFDEADEMLKADAFADDSGEG